MGPDPLTTPEAWDIAFIAGLPTPGICHIEGGELGFKWDIQKGYGSSGPPTVFTGAEAQKFSLVIEFWEGILGLSSDLQRQQFYDVLAPVLTKPPTGKGATALDFYHPAVSEPPLSIKSVQLEKLHAMKQDDNGLWSVKIDFVKFSRPKPGLGKATGSKTKTGNASKPTAKDALDKIIDANRQKIKDLNQSNA